VLTGLSGEKLMRCLHGLTQVLCDRDKVYLEIGVFQGLTLISNAAVNRGIDCFGVDNFSLFNEGLENLEVVQTRMAKLGVSNAKVINLDFEEALHTLDRHIGGRKIGVFFVDGPHDYRSQLVSLLKAKPYLADDCVIVIDDCNYAHVRQANADFLRSHPEFALLCEAYTPGHGANLNEEARTAAAAGWWNGANILLRDVDRTIPRKYPREESKDMYFLSHDVFRHEFAEMAFPAIRAVQAMLDGSPAEADSALGKVRAEFLEHRRRHPARYKHQNTSSEGLPPFMVHG
jgi:hypothetical protein